MEVTHDTIAMRGAGVVQVTQPAKVHRFTLDSILLADYCRIKPKDHVLEAGAGTGIISLLLAKKHPRSSFTALEVQPSLAALCEQNISDNGLGDRITVLARDLRRPGKSLVPGFFSFIVANPPYIKDGTGRTSPESVRRTSRQDHAASIESWLNLQRYLKNGGRYGLVFPAARLAELLALMRKRSLEPKRLRLVHSHADKPASLVLVEAAKMAGAGMEVLPPLIVHERDSGYTNEMRAIYDMPG